MRHIMIIAVCLWAACGSDPDSAPDAGMTPDAAPGSEATINVFLDGELFGDDATQLFFFTAAGELIAAPRIGASGVVRQGIPEGAIVKLGFAGYDGLPGETWITVHGLSPGDDVEIGERRARPDSVNTPITLPPFAGAVSYNLQTCTSAIRFALELSDEIPLSSECVSNGQMAAVAFARDAGGQDIAYAVLNSAVGTALTAADWRTDFVATTFQDAGFQALVAEYHVGDTRFRQRVSGASPPSVALQYPNVDGFGVELRRGAGTDGIASIIARQATAPTGVNAVPIDAVVADLDLSDPSGPRVNWAGMNPDLGDLLSLAVTLTDDDTGRTINWLAFAAPDESGEIFLPSAAGESDLPAEIGSQRLNMAFTDVEWLDGYDEARSDLSAISLTVPALDFRLRGRVVREGVTRELSIDR